MSARGRSQTTGCKSTLKLARVSSLFTLLFLKNLLWHSDKCSLINCEVSKSPPYLFSIPSSTTPNQLNQKQKSNQSDSLCINLELRFGGICQEPCYKVKVNLVLALWQTKVMRKQKPSAFSRRRSATTRMGIQWVAQTQRHVFPEKKRQKNKTGNSLVSRMLSCNHAMDFTGSTPIV